MPPATSCDGDENAVGSGCWKERIEGPFRRLDPNPHTLELARLVLCAVTLVPIRVFLIVTFVPTYYVVARTFLAVAPDTPWAQAVNIYFVRLASWLLLRMMGFWRIDVTGRAENAGTREEPRVFVSNHISFVEILYFLAELGPSFVMKRTCLRVPLIGSIATRVLDSVSVDNKGGKKGGSGSTAIAARLVRMFGEGAVDNGFVQEDTGSNDVAADRWARGWRGNPLLLFPEGTTSNGSCLLRFKTGVFAGGMPVHPVIVKYDCRRFSPAFESILFPVHTLRMLAEPANHLRVEYLPRYFPTPEERADRNLYAKAAQGIFCEAMGLPAVDSGYAEKTKYHQYLMKQFRAHPWGRAAFVLPRPDRHEAFLSSKLDSGLHGMESPVVNGGEGGVNGNGVVQKCDVQEPSQCTDQSSDFEAVQERRNLEGAAGEGDEGSNQLRRRKG